MVLNSFKFLLLFSIVFAVYWLIPAKNIRFRNIFLLIVSYLIYMNWNPFFSLALLGVTVITYFGAIIVNKKDEKNGFILACFTLIGLLPLIAFKYYNFINDNVSELLKILRINFSFPGLNWAVPVGISFFTFQAIGYLLDVYHDKCPCENNFFDYALFVSFFPQITSGPISKADELLPQIKSKRGFEYCRAVSGLRYLLFGMFLKVVIADRAGIYVDTVFSNLSKYSGIECLATSVIYSMQIYTDFAGYSCMALGIGKLLGFNLVNNFNRPYFADSITEFWRRWHISLSRWLKEHIYIPLGGSRCNKARNYFNIILTFLVSGIWHGANWTFVVWGFIHGLCQIIEKMFGLQKKSKNSIIRIIKTVITFAIVNFAWVIFRAPNLSTAFVFFKQIATFYKGFSINSGGLETLAYFFVGFIPFAIFEFAKEFLPKQFQQAYKNTTIRRIGYVVAFVMIILIGVLDGGNFIYVSF